VPGDPHRGLIAISPSVEYLERAWEEAKYGGTSSEPYIEAVFPTVHEPELAPEGKHIALCFTQFGAYAKRGRRFTERDAEAYDRYFDRLVAARQASTQMLRAHRHEPAPRTGPSGWASLGKQACDKEVHFPS
jgi:phytoene dehydrogenase-like protein